MLIYDKNMLKLGPSMQSSVEFSDYIDYSIYTMKEIRQPNPENKFGFVKVDVTDKLLSFSRLKMQK